MGETEAANNENRGWDYLLKLARHPDPDQRMIALVRGFAWLENALAAAGLWSGKGPSAPKLYKAAPELFPGLTEKDLTSLRRDIRLRHQTAHLDEVPGSATCTQAVQQYMNVWALLRNRVVNVDRALDVADRIIRCPHILALYLYGSMARREGQPKDIDLLICDDGRYSDDLLDSDLEYQEGDVDRGKRTKRVLEALGLAEKKLLAMAASRWLDILVLDLSRFGAEIEYTLAVRDRQRDPFFFENIAADLRRLRPAEREFLGCDTEPFLLIRSTVAQVRQLGLPDRKFSPLEIALSTLWKTERREAKPESRVPPSRFRFHFPNLTKQDRK
jgi:hypothetical protein